MWGLCRIKFVIALMIDFTLSNQEKIGAYMLYYGQPEGEDDNVMAYHLVLQKQE